MHNIEIQFNTNIIRKVKSLNLQVDQIGSVLFILFALYENRLDLLDEFDDYNRQKRALLLYKELETRDLLLEEEKPGLNQPIFSLTKQGIELIEYIKGEFTKQNEEITSEKIAISGVEVLKEAITDQVEVESWIEEWIDIFPRGIRSGGRLIRSDRASCLRKMKMFIREYDFDKETIMQATRNYIESRRNDNFAYTKCAVYFIYRIEGSSRAEKTSDLASWCEDVLHNKTENKNSENNLEFMA